MNAVITKEKSFIEQRKAEVAQIISKHSQKLFGHAYATIREIRNEAVKKRLESIFNA
jgi:hypothetical protein